MENKLAIRDVTEIIKDAKEHWIKVIRKGKWGHWKYNPDNLTLEFKKIVGGHHFNHYVDLKRLTNSARVLDCIFQRQSKLWCSDKDIADLLRAFNDLMQSVQNKVCSGGKDKEFDFKKHLIEQVNPIIKKSSN
jgi:hypothetical protein